MTPSIMRRLIPIILAGLCTATAWCRIDVSGHVLDASDSTPLRGATVTVKDRQGKIRKFAVSKSDGSFLISPDSVEGCLLEVSMLNFAKESLPLDSIDLPVTVALSPQSTMLKEVTVKAERIRAQGDTISYLVGSFAQTQDRSIGDVLARMPGISVDKSGRVEYQGEEINKFYIEGSDLLGGKYGIATNGISHDDVGAVEVMEQHQPMQVLSGLSFSDRAAINLKLKNRAKATWTLHGTAGAGYSWQPQGPIWDGELFAMAVMPSFQNISTLKTNNRGASLSDESLDFLASRRGTSLSRYLNVTLPSVPNLSSQRTTFNKSLLASTNSLWKLRTGTLKLQADYTYSHLNADASSVTTYFLPQGERVITEQRSGTDRSHSLSAKSIYEVNQKTAFINNTLQTNLDWDNISTSTLGTLSNSQNANLPDYYIANRLKVIKRFHGNHLVTFGSINEWESLPQTLTVTLSEGMNPQAIRQEIQDHAIHTDQNAAYTFVAGGVTIGVEGGVSGYLRKMNSDLSALPVASPSKIGADMQNDIPRHLQGESSADPIDEMQTVNVVETNHINLYATPKFEYRIGRVNLTLTSPLTVSSYRFHQAIANREEVYFSPSLHINWKPSQRCDLSLRAHTGNSPMSLNMIYPGAIMTDYRTLRQGTDAFYHTGSQSLSSTLSYKIPRIGLFINGMGTMRRSNTPYTLSRTVYGDYAIYSYSPAKNNGELQMARLNIGKTLDFMRGSSSLGGTYTRQKSHLISQAQEAINISTLYSATLSLSGTPLPFLAFDYKGSLSANRMAINGANASWLHTITNSLLLNILPHSSWEWRISGEHYINQISADTYKPTLLLDTKAVYKPSKRLEVALSLSNIFDTRQYSYTTYSQLASYESSRLLRGRELLLSVTLKK